ncbi:hypothetical protein [Mucilaginibacter ginsenosidivorans]|uniref:Uncharacterized protein n=1 Tax=Mucilaginibacter ginsenosidivorans TaxID=398053 RepID=A0A5B8UUC6_9SPHI|nr:hypothetical protein [Mucilaginibacter ginsenosidivorans]QEC62522.1 hypothetical protein FRZ54_07945 [Mucilaginibacter ginsenosidivorans]
MNLTDQKIENELRLKRIKPEAFIAQFENYFDDVATTYQVTSREIRQQRKNIKAHFKPYHHFTNIMDIGDITNKVLAHSEAAKQAVAEGKPVPPGPNYAAIEADLKERNRFIDNFDTNPERFKKILDEYHINQLRDQLASGALNAWLTSRFLGATTKLLLLLLAIGVSLYVEDPMTKLLKSQGKQQAIILTTTFIYFTLDIVVDWIKDLLLWQRVKTCYLRFKKVRAIIEP